MKLDRPSSPSRSIRRRRVGARDGREGRPAWFVRIFPVRVAVRDHGRIRIPHGRHLREEAARTREDLGVYDERSDESPAADELAHESQARDDRARVPEGEHQASFATDNVVLADASPEPVEGLVKGRGGRSVGAMGGSRDDRRARAAVTRERLGPRDRDVDDVVRGRAEVAALRRDGRERRVERGEVGDVPRYPHVRRGPCAKVPEHARGGPHRADIPGIQAVVRQRVVGAAPAPGAHAVAHRGVIGEAVDGDRDEQDEAQSEEQGPEKLDRAVLAVLGASPVASRAAHDVILRGEGFELLVSHAPVGGPGAAGSHASRRSGEWAGRPGQCRVRRAGRGLASQTRAASRQLLR